MGRLGESFAKVGERQNDNFSLLEVDHPFALGDAVQVARHVLVQPSYHAHLRGGGVVWWVPNCPNVTAQSVKQSGQCRYAYFHKAPTLSPISGMAGCKSCVATRTSLPLSSNSNEHMFVCVVVAKVAVVVGMVAVVSSKKDTHRGGPDDSCTADQFCVVVGVTD